MRFLRLLLPVFILPLCLAGQDERRAMERSYSAWRNAIGARDLNGWRQATAAHRQMLTRNLIVSQKQPFPDALFNLPMRPAEISTLRFLEAKVNGPTAHLAYFGKVDLGLTESAEVPENILILKFIKEPTGWKFDTSRLINLASAPEVRASLKNGGSDPALNDPSFQPSGVTPAIPKPCPLPDRIGVLQIASIGYATKATVNGFEVATVQDNAEEHIIIGGLRDGENPLLLEPVAQPVPEGAERQLEVHALILTGDQNRPVIRVFSWKPEGSVPDGPVKLTIHVSRITMRR